MTTSPQSLPSGTGLDRFFATLHRSPVRRSQDHVIAGVCSGLALKLGVSVKVVRILTVVAALLGPALVLYLAAWLFLPDAQDRVQLERAIRGGETSSIVLLVVALLVVVPDAGLRPRFGLIVPVVVLGAVAWFLWNRRHATGVSGSAPAPAPYISPYGTAPYGTAPSDTTPYGAPQTQPDAGSPSLVKHPEPTTPRDSTDV